MMSPKECSEAWKEVCRIYDETREVNRPDNTMDKIIEELGIDKTLEVFATVAAIKKHDGRIYGNNRTFIGTIPVNPESLKWEHGNPMVSSYMDHIHTAHINNLITELRNRRAYYEKHC